MEEPQLSRRCSHYTANAVVVISALAVLNDGALDVVAFEVGSYDWKMTIKNVQRESGTHLPQRISV